jgi:hypothetical protein
MHLRTYFSKLILPSISGCGQPSEGFLITTYITDAIKEGDRIWPR